MKKFNFVGTSPYKFRSSTPPPPGVPGCTIGKGIDFPDTGINNVINFHNFGIRNGTYFQDFGMKYKV